MLYSRLPVRDGEMYTYEACSMVDPFTKAYQKKDFSTHVQA